MYQRYFKRILDIIFSLFLIILLSPIYLIVYFLIKFDMKGSPIFKQLRPGYHGEIFNMYKFKTMKNPVDSEGHVLSDNERLQKIKNSDQSFLDDSNRTTKLGKFLRASSIDELPELFNVLKGEMSFIGPRPLSTIYINYYTPEEMKRHDVLPGITGLAQVKGRNSLSWEERFRYDIEYVNHVTFMNDVAIFFKTIQVVFKRDDIGQGNEKPLAFNIYREKQKNEEDK